MRGLSPSVCSGGFSGFFAEHMAYGRAGMRKGMNGHKGGEQTRRGKNRCRKSLAQGMGRPEKGGQHIAAGSGKEDQQEGEADPCAPTEGKDEKNTQNAVAQHMSDIGMHG